MAKGRPPGTSRDEGSSPRLQVGVPKCPAELNPVGKKKWKEIVRKLRDSGLLERTDTTLMYLYCEAWETFVAAKADVDKIGTLLQGNKGVYTNPRLHDKNRAREDVTKIGTKLGLDALTQQRLKVRSGPKAAGIPTRDRKKGPPPPTRKADNA